MAFTLDLGDVVAIFALLLSGWSLKKSLDFGRNQDRLNQILIDKEEEAERASKVARIAAYIMQVGKSDFWLTVHNYGPCKARNVRLVDLDGDGSVLISGDIQRKFPAPVLVQGESIRVVAAFTLDSKPRVHVKVMWDDDSANDHEEEFYPAI